MTSELPSVGVDDIHIKKDKVGEIHVFANPDEKVLVHQEDKFTGEVRTITHITVPLIRITHVFSCINICGVPRKLFEHEAVNAMKQTYVIVILAYFTLFQPNSH